ncbi:MAG: dihydropteroate synthase, partial [Anaerolineae bacterium]|nr:dihydropteroate synthase [Anaerolineae bacterium]
MGIVNVTPDSFSDGGQFATHEAAIAHGEQLAAEGADILDVGGESTRPGATPPSVAEELRRVLPVVAALAARGHCVSVDTRRPEVMREALAAGAAIVNDVAALRAPGAIEAVAASDCGIILMHMQGTPETMQHSPCLLYTSDAADE